MDFNVSDEMKSWMKNEIDAGYDLGYYETYEDFAEQMDDWMELNDDEKSWAKEYGKKFFTKDNFDKSSDKKPLHIQSLEKQIARNPEYKKIADSLSKEKDVNDAYFYAFKDAYERNGYEPSENNISDELSDKYWELADGFRDSRGMSDTEWDRFGWEEFERKYGTEADFIDKGLEAHNKYFDELGGSESSDISDKDEQHSESEIVEEDKPNKIRIHPTEGPQVNSGDGWSQISSEEYEELKKGGYEEVDYDDDPDSKQEEDLVKGLDNLEKYIPEDQKEVLQKIRKKLLGNEDA